MIETREVLADAYRGRSRTLLSHAVELTAAGDVVRVLCGRVALDSVADHYAQDTTLPPTCRRCAARAKRTPRD